MASRSILFVSPGRFRSINGVVGLQKKLAAIPDEVTARIKPALEKGADELVALLKQTAPVSDLEDRPGQMRDSARREPGDHELSVRVLVDAKDDQGREYPKHVEAGHKAKDGSHVAAKPFFWPSYNVKKKSIRSKVQRAATAGIKAAVASGGSATE